jgi:hypothetical protein
MSTVWIVFIFALIAVAMEALAVHLARWWRKFSARRNLMKKLENGYTFIRFPYGNYVVRSQNGDEEIIPIWLGIEFWNKGIVVPVFDIGEDRTRRITFRLAKEIK